MTMACDNSVNFLKWLIHQLPHDGHFSLELFFLPGQIESAQLSPVNIKVMILKMDNSP